MLGGQATSAYARRTFMLRVSQVPSGEWRLEDLAWRSPPSQDFRSRELLRGMVDLAARLLRTVNTWWGEQHEGAAKLVFNEMIPPSGTVPRVCFSFRPQILSIDPPPWSNLWELIQARIRWDPSFWVQGICETEVLQAVGHLERIFPSDWVRAQYKKHGVGEGSCLMNWPMPSSSPTWFPAFHLARTAAGAVCVDPAWVYLIEIGLARQGLEGVPGIHILERQLTRSPGSRHHLCMGAMFHARGLLLELEPNAASGNNDLLVKGSESLYEIEVKEFTSERPLDRLQSEIGRKVATMPRKPELPVVIHVVLADGHGADPLREATFLETLATLAENLPPQISALVGGRCFLDASGSAVKRDAQQIVLNPAAIVPSSEQDLEALFAENYDTILYPTFGFGNFVDTQAS